MFSTFKFEVLGIRYVLNGVTAVEGLTKASSFALMTKVGTSIRSNG